MPKIPIKLLSKQLIEPVKYKQSIKNYEEDVDIFVELGGKVLMGINRKITKKKTIPVIENFPSKIPYIKINGDDDRDVITKQMIEAVEAAFKRS